MKTAPVGLMVQACLVGLLVQIVVVLVARSHECSLFWALFWALFVTYFPIIVAANMGYQEGQLVRPTKGPIQNSHDNAANIDPSQDPPTMDHPPAEG